MKSLLASKVMYPIFSPILNTPNDSINPHSTPSGRRNLREEDRRMGENVKTGFTIFNNGVRVPFEDVQGVVFFWVVYLMARGDIKMA